MKVSIPNIIERKVSITNSIVKRISMRAEPIYAFEQINIVVKPPVKGHKFKDTNKFMIT